MEPDIKTPSLHSRRQALAGMAAGALSLAPGLSRSATTYPDRPVRLVVPYAAGGGTDALARALAEAMGPTLGQPLVVENRTGAAGQIGTDAVAKAAPDGYTLLMGLSDSLLVAPYLYKRLSYDPRRELSLVNLVASGPMVLVASPKVPAGAKPFLDYIAAHKGQLSYGSWGVGSFPHLGGLTLSRLLDADMVHVPYRGEAPMIQDLLGGQIQLAYCGLRIARPHIEAGRLRAIGITGEQRISSAPEFPTLIEQGLTQPHHRLTVWLGLAAPAGTPRETVELISAHARRASQQAGVRQCVADLGCDVRAAGPQEFASVYDQQAPLWERLVRESGVRLES